MGIDAGRVRILHLTDTHIAADGAWHGGVDTCSALRAVLRRAALSLPDVLVVSGDVSDDMSVVSYQLVRDIVHQWADPLGVAVLWAVGNHDGRAGFRQVLCADVDEPDELGGRGVEAPVFGCVSLAGLDFIILDTSVLGKSYGHVDECQLDWLNTQLHSRREVPAVLLMHHPLIPAATELMNGLALDNPCEVMRILCSSRVRVVLTGHYHALAISNVCNGITTVVGAPVTAQSDSIGDYDHESAARGAGACIVDVYAGRNAGDGNIVVRPYHVADPEGEGQVFDLSPTTVRRIIKSSGIPTIG